MACAPKAERDAVRYLEIGYQGYFMCRIATDPDPTNELKGRSGYTLALPGEDELDQAIRLQFKDTPRNLREPAHRMDGKEFESVAVYSMAFNGQALTGHEILGAPVDLIGTDAPLTGPIFESRNNIVGSDNTMAFVVNPFHLVFKNGDGKDFLHASAAVNPANPDQKIWEVTDPAIYGPRLPVGSVFDGDDELNMATGVFDYDEYFRARAEWLRLQIAGRALEIRLFELLQGTAQPQDLAKLLDEITVPGYRAQATALLADIRQQDPDFAKKWRGDILDELLAEAELAMQKYKTRLYQLEFWGNRVVSKMGTKISWDHFVEGDRATSSLHDFEAGGKTWSVDYNQPWRIKYWYGGWDGDLLLGYHRGALYLPALPAS